MKRVEDGTSNAINAMLAVYGADGCNTISSHQNRDKTRKGSTENFPLEFDVRLTSYDVYSDFKLSINDVSDEVPVVLQRGGKMMSYRVSSEAAAFYMDVSSKAAFIVWRACDTDSDTFLIIVTIILVSIIIIIIIIIINILT
ncbi:hypothetical protein MAR_014303 [Mya arenaria]|uniref:Uncharacterized protein n=1 Tax=Mya arenaria TaxID=6604 RepID=A0ABY7G5H1_MYAAR|nr:hypothetical protein MAR_014303 [Mya arenaria]